MANAFNSFRYRSRDKTNPDWSPNCHLPNAAVVLVTTRIGYVNCFSPRRLINCKVPEKSLGSCHRCSRWPVFEFTTSWLLVKTVGWFWKAVWKSRLLTTMTFTLSPKAFGAWASCICLVPVTVACLIPASFEGSNVQGMASTAAVLAMVTSACCVKVSLFNVKTLRKKPVKPIKIISESDKVAIIVSFDHPNRRYCL